jgi:DNA polymerase-3 subunit beta
MIKKTQFAITGEDTRYYLNGALPVCGRSDDARDDRRSSPGAGDGAARRENPDRRQDRDVILPRKTLSELDRVLADGDADVSIAGANTLLRLGNRVLISRVIEPPGLRPGDSANNDVGELRPRSADAGRQAGRHLSNERSRAVKLQEPGRVESLEHSDVGDAREVLQVEYDGPSLQLCFNGQYIQDFLAAVETEQVSLEFKDDVSQAVMRPVNAEGYEYTYVIMPMRL